MSDSIVVNVLSPEVTNITVNDTGENIYINPLTLNQGIINHSVTHQSGGSDELLHNLLGGLQGGSGGSYYHLTSGEYANLVTGVVVRPSDTGAFLTIGSADPRYVNITGQEVISGIKTFANGIYSPIISGASLTGTSITVDSDTFIMNCDLDMNNHSIKNVSTNSISFFNSGSGVADAIMSLGSEVYDGSLHDYIFSFDKNLKVQDRVIAKQGDQGITISNVLNAADNSEYLGSADILLPYSDEFLFIPEFNEVNRIPSNGTLISFGQDNLFSHKVTDVANSFYQNTSGKIIKIIPSIKPEEIKYLYDNGANGTTETVRSVEVYQVGQNQACLVYALNLENGGLIFSESQPSIQTAKLSVDSTVVRTSGDQTISGFKTFANRPNVNGTGVLLSGEIIVPNTGELTGVFYPLNSNPNGYVTGDVVRPNETGNFIAFTALTGDRGDITVTGNSPSNLNFSIDSFAITSGKIADSAVTTAKIANFNVTTDKLSSLSVTTNIIATNAVTNTKLADMASQRIKGRISAGTSDPEDLTASQVRTLIDFDHTVSGLLSGYVTGSVVRPSETGAFYAASNPSGFITGVDLSFSGNYYTKSESESRYVNTTGTETILGDKTFHDKVYINSLYVTGLETIVNTTNTNVASNFIMLNLTGGAVDGGLFFVTGAGLTGINDSGAILGFDHSDKFKFGIGTRASDLSVLDTIASVEEMTGISGNLQTQISSLSNATGSYVLNSQTGAFYPTSNPSGFVTGLVVRPSETGSFITTAQTGSFYPISNPSGYVTGSVVRPSETGSFITSSQTGAFYPTSNPSGFATLSDPVRTTVTGNGAISIYAISGAGSLVNPSALIVSIDGALQEPSVDYGVSGGNIIFTSPLESGAKAVVISPVNTVQVGQVVPSDGSVTSAKIANSVTLTTPSLVGPVNLTSQDASTADRVMTRDLVDSRTIIATLPSNLTVNNNASYNATSMVLSLTPGWWEINGEFRIDSVVGTAGAKLYLAFTGGLPEAYLHRIWIASVSSGTTTPLLLHANPTYGSGTQPFLLSQSIASTAAGSFKVGPSLIYLTANATITVGFSQNTANASDTTMLAFPLSRIWATRLKY